MQITIELINKHALHLLQDLEQMNIIRLLPTPVGNLSAAENTTISKAFAPNSGAFDFWLSEEENKYQMYIEESKL